MQGQGSLLCPLSPPSILLPDTGEELKESALPPPPPSQLCPRDRQVLKSTPQGLSGPPSGPSPAPSGSLSLGHELLPELVFPRPQARAAE